MISDFDGYTEYIIERKELCWIKGKFVLKIPEKKLEATSL